MMKKNLTEPQTAFLTPALKEKFEDGYGSCRVILVSAPCGCGKTAACLSLLKGKKICRWNGAESIFSEKEIPQGTEAVFMDDLQYLTNQEEREELCRIIAEHSSLHFILAGRCRVPGYLMPFKTTGSMLVITINDLLMDRETSLGMLKVRGIVPSPLDMGKIQRDMKGYPLAMEMLCHYLNDSQTYSEEAYSAAKRDVLVYLDEAVFKRFEQPVRELLLDVSLFDTFTLELAKIVSGNSRTGEILGMLERDTSMLIYESTNHYRFQHIFREMLLWENERRRTDEERRVIYGRAALYHELEGDFEKSLEYYSKAGEQSKVSSLLIKNAEQHPGIGHYREMQDYYFALPEEEVRRSPSFMCALSLLTSMRLDYETSEKWYGELKKYSAGLSKSDPEYLEAMSKIAYLDISFPQRWGSGLIDVIRNVFRVMSSKNLKIPSVSVTSTLPSIMNGGKDFCEWSKKDTLLYATMRRPVETVLGRDGVGLADCSICESRFEKGCNVTEEMLNLMSRLGEIQAKGTPDIEFAVIGLLARIQVSQNKAPQAIASVESLRSKFEKAGEERFLGNIDALLARIHLRTGDIESVHEWLASAPGNEAYLWPMWRYQYLTRAMAQIEEGNTEDTMLLLSKLTPYCDTSGRVMDRLHVHILMAICRYRQNDPLWKDEMTEALNTSLEYSFVWPISQYGAAILPLLKECGWEKNKVFIKKLTGETRIQAVYYPRFLKIVSVPVEQLYTTEMQVLRLICQNLANAEIGEIMDIRLATVKTHVRNIFQKLDVKNRSEAKEMAEKLHLL